MKKLTGLIAAAFTPMHEDGQVDLTPIPGIVDALLRNSIAGFYVCGSTGEGPSLTTEEREATAQAYVEAVAGRVPVVIQVGHNSIEDARRLARHAAAIGADAVSAVSPSYFIPEDAAALIETLGRITDAAPNLPFYYYHIPRLSGVSLNPVNFMKQAPRRIPTLAGIKYSSRELEIMQQCLALDGGRFNVLFGVDEMLLSGLISGCDGAVGSTYNFMAPIYHQIQSAATIGDLDTARALQLKAAELIQIILRYHGNAALKAMMTLIGLPCGPARYPLTPVSPDEQAQLRDELTTADFFTYAVKTG